MPLSKTLSRQPATQKGSDPISLKGLQHLARDLGTAGGSSPNPVQKKEKRERRNVLMQLITVHRSWHAGTWAQEEEFPGPWQGTRLENLQPGRILLGASICSRRGRKCVFCKMVVRCGWMKRPAYPRPWGLFSSMHRHKSGCVPAPSEGPSGIWRKSPLDSWAHF